MVDIYKVYILLYIVYLLAAKITEIGQSLHLYNGLVYVFPDVWAFQMLKWITYPIIYRDFTVCASWKRRETMTSGLEES